MLIYKKIYQDYKESMKAKHSDDSKENVEFITLNFVIGKIYNDW